MNSIPDPHFVKKCIAKYHIVIKRLNSVGLDWTDAAAEALTLAFHITLSLKCLAFGANILPKTRKGRQICRRSLLTIESLQKGLERRQIARLAILHVAHARGLKRKVAAVRANSKRRKRRKSSSWKGLQIRRDTEVQEVPHPCSPDGDHGPNPCHLAFPKVVIWAALNWG